MQVTEPVSAKWVGNISPWIRDASDMIKRGVIAIVTIIIAIGCGERRSVASPGECLVGTGDRVASVYAKYKKDVRFLPSISSYPTIASYMKENAVAFQKLQDIELIGIDKIHADVTVSARFHLGASIHTSVPESRVIHLVHFPNSRMSVGMVPHMFIR